MNPIEPGVCPRHRDRLDADITKRHRLSVLQLAIALRRRLRKPDTRPIRVAVVPFDDETGEDSFDQVAVAIADQTVARLGTPDRLARLSVIANAAALRKPRAFRDWVGVVSNSANQRMRWWRLWRVHRSFAGTYAQGR